jgi:hypothetical protein
MNKDGVYIGLGWHLSTSNTGKYWYSSCHALGHDYKEHNHELDVAFDKVFPKQEEIKATKQ